MIWPALLLSLIILVPSVFCLRLSDINTLDDLYQAYYDGEIDYDLVLLLTENLDGSVIGAIELDSIVSLLTQPDKDDSDYAESSLLWQRYFTYYANKAGYRERYYSHRSPKRKAFVSQSGDRLEFLSEFQADGRHIESGKRNLSYASKNFSAKIGNFYIREGFGLAIGRYDYTPTAGFPDTARGEFIYPLNSCYNGLHMKINGNAIGSSIYFSRKKYLDATKNFLGAGVNYRIGEMVIGGNIGHNYFADDSISDRRTACGINLNFERRSSTFGAELAFIDGDIGLFCGAKLLRAGWSLRPSIWSYAADFQNYNCSGPAKDDYRSFYPANCKIGFRSAQAGESGFEMRLENRVLRLGLQSWWPPPARKYHLRVYASSKLILNDRLHHRLSADFSTLRSGHRLWLKDRFEIFGFGLLRCLGSRLYFIESRGLIRSNSYFLLEAEIGDIGQNRVFSRMRNFLDGDNELLLCLAIRHWKFLLVDAELTLKEKPGGEIRIEYHFGQKPDISRPK